MENNKEIEMIVTLLAGTLTILVMAVVIVYSVIKYQKKVLTERENFSALEKKFQTELLDATITISEKERQIIGKNVHDDIGTLINVIKNNNNRVKTSLSENTPALEIIYKNNDLLLEINESVRSITNDLISPTLHKLGFIKALNQLCEQITESRIANIKVIPEDINFRLESKIEIQLFRICKEVINNMVKHSNANEIEIFIEFDPVILKLSVTHNGTGVNNEQIKDFMANSKGLGLKSIYSRIQVLEGNISYVTIKDNSSRVSIELPLKN